MGLDSRRGITCRCAGSRSLLAFLGYRPVMSTSHTYYAHIARDEIETITEFVGGGHRSVSARRSVSRSVREKGSRINLLADGAECGICSSFVQRLEHP